MYRFNVFLLCLFSLLAIDFSKPHHEKFLSRNEENSKTDLINARRLDEDDEDEEDADEEPTTTQEVSAYHQCSGGISGGGVAAVAVSSTIVSVGVVSTLVAVQTGAVAAFSSGVASIGTIGTFGSTSGALMGGNTMTGVANTMVAGNMNVSSEVLVEYKHQQHQDYRVQRQEY